MSISNGHSNGVVSIWKKICYMLIWINNHLKHITLYREAENEWLSFSDVHFVSFNFPIYAKSQIPSRPHRHTWTLYWKLSAICIWVCMTEMRKWSVCMSVSTCVCVCLWTGKRVWWMSVYAFRLNSRHV